MISARCRCWLLSASNCPVVACGCWLQIDKALGIRPQRGGRSRGAAAEFGGTQMPRQSSRYVAAAGALHAAAAGNAAGQAHSPSGHYQQGSPAAPPAGAGGGKGRGCGHGSSRRRNNRAAESEDDYWDNENRNSDSSATAWDGQDDDADDAGIGGPVLGGGYARNDYSGLTLKPDHYNKPLWVCNDGSIFLETYSPTHKQVSVMWCTHSA